MDENESGFANRNPYAMLHGRRMPLHKEDVYGTASTSKSKRKYFLTALVIALVIIIGITLIIQFALPKDVKEHVKHKFSDIIHYDSDDDDDDDYQRLSSNVVPIAYKLAIVPDMKNFVFDGVVSISMDVQSKTHSICLHASELNIQHVFLTQNGSSVENKDFEMDVERELLCLHSDHSFYPDTPDLQLTIYYKARITDSMNGFYRSSYHKSDGSIEYLAVTDFEPTDARKAFPCFDEPSFKATFEVSVYKPSGYNVLSNMPLRSLSNDSWAHFYKTPRMSTYLVCWCVSKFGAAVATAKSGTVVRAWTRPGRIGDASYAATFGAAVLDFYADYFGIPYALPKLDMIAIPDFEAGAMENWGAVTFRETALLYNANESSAADKQYVASVIAHELSHQWFGNLVTLRWWTDLWLNEGFAAYMEYVGMNAVHPEWPLRTEFIVNEVLNALWADSFKSSHPIIANIERPNQIAAHFDAISYSKGAAILSMIRDYVGGSAFRKGLHTYLKSHAYGNAGTEDLWLALSESSSLNISNILSRWTTEAGYPIVRMDIKKNNSSLKLTQERFLLTSSDDGKYWWIPFSMNAVEDFENSTKISAALKQKHSKSYNTHSNITSNNVTYVGNPGHTGFYRMRYKNELLRQRILEMLAQNSMSDVDVIGLIDDSFAYTFKDGSELDILFKMLNVVLPGCKNYGIWKTAINALNHIRFLVDNSNAFQNFILDSIEPVLPYVGWNVGTDDSQEKRMLRPLLLSTAISYGHNDSISTALSNFNSYLNGSVDIHPDLRSLVYAAAVTYGPTSNFDWMVLRYSLSTSATERRRALYAMASVANTQLLRRVLDLSMSTTVRRQDTAGLLIHAANNMVALNNSFLVYDFFKNNHELFYERYGQAPLETIIRGITRPFHTEDILEDVKQFFHEHESDHITAAARRSIEVIEANVVWCKKNENVV